MTCLYKCNGLKQGKWSVKTRLSWITKGLKIHLGGQPRLPLRTPKKSSEGLVLYLLGFKLRIRWKLQVILVSLFQMLLQQVDLLFTAVSPIPINFVSAWMEAAAAAGCSQLCCRERKGPLGCTHPKDSPRELLVRWQLSLILGSLSDLCGFTFFLLHSVFCGVVTGGGRCCSFGRGLWGCAWLSRGRLCVGTQQTDWLRENSAEN